MVIIYHYFFAITLRLTRVNKMKKHIEDHIGTVIGFITGALKKG